MDPVIDPMGTSLGASEPLFSRADGVTWRDTGRRVVALDPSSSDVRVLGGGAAALWRLLDLPASASAVADRLRETDGSAPHREVVVTCLGELVEIGLLRELS